MLSDFYFAVGGVRSIAISVSVCLSVRSHISKITRSNFTNFLQMLPVAVARSSSDNSVIRYVFPVLWTTSSFHMMGHMWCTTRLTTEGCQSAGGNAERGGAEELKLRPSLRCFSLTDIRRLQPSLYTTEFGCADEQCTSLGVEVCYPRLPYYGRPME